MAGTIYTVHMAVRAEHTRGPEPPWEGVDEAIAKHLQGHELTMMVDLPERRFASGHVLITAAEIDSAEES